LGLEPKGEVSGSVEVSILKGLERRDMKKVSPLWAM